MAIFEFPGDDNNGEDLPVESFEQLSLTLQKYFFQVVFQLLEHVIGSEDLEWAVEKSYEIASYSEKNDGLGNEQIEETYKLYEIIRQFKQDDYDHEVYQKIEEAITKLAVVVDRLNNGEWGDSELNPELQEAHEALYEGFILHYKEKWISLWDTALWIDGEFLFLQGFDPEWDKGLQFKLLHDLYIPGLEKILQDTDEPLAPAAGEYVTQALLKLQWIDAQVQVGNDDKETLKPRFKEAFDFLVQAIIEDVKAHFAEFFEMAEMAFPTILQNARWPGKATLYIQVALSILRQVDAYLKDNPDFFDNLEAIVEKLLEPLQDFAEIYELLSSIWETVKANTELDEWLERLKELAREAYRIYAERYWSFYNDYDDLRKGAKALPDIRDLLVEMKAAQDSQQAEVEEILEQHRQATQNYLHSNEELFNSEPPEKFDPSPFVSLPSGTTRKDLDNGGVSFILPDATMLRVSAEKVFSAILPGGDEIEFIEVQPNNHVRLSDAREFEVQAEEIPNPAEDEQIQGLPDGSTLTERTSCREAILPDDTRIRYYPDDDLVAISFAHGAEAFVTFTKVWGIGVTGEMSRVSGTVRSFRFDNGMTGVADWEKGYELVLPSGAHLHINRPAPQELPPPGASGSETTFTCEKRS